MFFFLWCVVPAILSFFVITYLSCTTKECDTMFVRLFIIAVILGGPIIWALFAYMIFRFKCIKVTQIEKRD